MRLLKYIFLVVVSMSLCFCDVDDDVVIEQEEDIEDFLEDNDAVYDDLDGVYRYYASDTTLTTNNTVIKKGVTFSFYYTAYTFNSSANNGVGTVISSNEQDIVDYFIAQGVDTQDWTTNPITAKYGSTTLLSGLYKGLKDCRKGDKVVIIMTSEYGFGDIGVSILDSYTPLIYFVTILND